ncbi:MAG: sulfatase-like hydrolase/transferase [Ekhidna sp.]
MSRSKINQMKNSSLNWISFLCLLLGGSCSSENESMHSAPNFVIILVDDLGYGDLQRYHTPSIDYLFENGVEFTNFHSNSLCTPTRSSLLTGKYPQNFGSNFERALVYEFDAEIGLPLSSNTIFKALQNNGYATAIFGKWHLGWRDQFNPMRYGFDQWVGCKSGEIDYQSKVNGQGEYDWYLNNDIFEEEGYVTDLIAKHSVAFIASNPDRNFALYIPFTSPHTPFQGPNDPADRFIGGEDNIDWPKDGSADNKARAYQEMIERLDTAVGSIIQELQRQNIEDKTMIVFMSDNGAADYGFTSNGNFKGHKGALWEGGTHVKCAIQWKDGILPGKTHELTHVFDIPMTIGSIAKVDFESDGVDLSKLVMNKVPLKDRFIYQRRTYRNGNKQVSITGKKWKYVIDDLGNEFLFNLQKDIGEQNNLSNTHPDTLKSLSNKLMDWEKKF